MSDFLCLFTTHYNLRIKTYFKHSPHLVEVEIDSLVIWVLFI